MTESAKRTLETIPTIPRVAIGFTGESQSVPLNTEPFETKYGW